MTLAMLGLRKQMIQCEQLRLQPITSTNRAQSFAHRVVRTPDLWVNGLEENSGDIFDRLAIAAAQAIPSHPTRTWRRRRSNKYMVCLACTWQSCAQPRPAPPRPAPPRPAPPRPTPPRQPLRCRCGSKPIVAMLLALLGTLTLNEISQMRHVIPCYSKWGVLSNVMSSLWLTITKKNCLSRSITSIVSCHCLLHLFKYQGKCLQKILLVFQSWNRITFQSLSTER